MDYFDILLAKKLEDDRDPKVEGLSVSANGRYHEDGVVYDPVIVNVPETPLSKLTVTQNGTYTAPTGTGYNEVDVDVPLPSNAYLLKEIEDVEIASFDDGSDLPMPKLEVGIEPVQDLHGYDAPWVGGAGKNKLPLSVSEIKSFNGGADSWTNNSKEISGIVYTILTDSDENVIGIKANGTATADSVLYLLSTTAPPIQLDGQSVIISMAGFSKRAYKDNSWHDIPETSTESAVTLNGDLVQMWGRIDNGVQVNNIVIQPMIRLASVSDSTFAPYSNICPISGHTEANVTVADDITNKKYFDGLLNGTYGIVDLGTLMWSYDSTYKYFYTTQLVASLGSKMPSFNLFCGLYKCITMEESNQFSDVTKDLIMAVVFHGHNNALNIRNLAYTDVATFKTAMNGVYLVYELATPTTPTVTPSEINELYGEFGINGHTYTIDLDGTRYGGKLDLVSGVLTVDRMYKDLGDYDWIADTGVTGLARTQDNTIKFMGKIISSQYIGVQNLPLANMPDGSIQATNIQTYLLLRIRDERLDGKTSTEIKNMLTGIQMVAELATPLTIQLPTTVVKSLEGVNNVSADSGDVLDLSYLAKEE